MVFPYIASAYSHTIVTYSCHMLNLQYIYLTIIQTTCFISTDDKTYISQYISTNRIHFEMSVLYFSTTYRFVEHNLH
jgi:hypothetical protein